MKLVENGILGLGFCDWKRSPVTERVPILSSAETASERGPRY